MSTAIGAVNNSIRDKLRRLNWCNPEWWVVIAAAVAWIVMLSMSHPHASHSGITLGKGHGRCALGMVAMVIAMMVPLTLANVRYVALSSLWRRRHRAIAGFLVGYLAVWFVVQTIIVGTWELLAPLIGWETVGGCRYDCGGVMGDRSDQAATAPPLSSNHAPCPTRMAGGR